MWNTWSRRTKATAFRNEENKFDFYEAMEKFLDKHLHPETAAASSATSSGSH